MAADLTGIVNEGEFFSQHYLDEILERDVRDTLRSADSGGADVAAGLKALSRDYYRALGVAGQLSHAGKLYEASRDFQIKLAETLGYTYQSGRVFVLGDGALPILHEVERSGQPYLVVVEGRFRTEDEAVLELPVPAALPEQALADGLKPVEPGTTLGDAIAAIFAVEAPPRWVLLVSGDDLILGERARWGKGRYLRFELGELLSRKDPAALDITAALLSRATLAPNDGAPVHDTLDERSHKHAHGVSSDLKHAAREAVELLGNEYVHWERTQGKQALYTEQAARELTDECLTYLYRLLFLFYAEARAAELRSLPMGSPEYARGYSLEVLRELEQVPLNTLEAQDGTFFDQSLKRLFELVNDGHDPFEQSLGLAAPGEKEKYLDRGFSLKGVHSPLFDPRSTPRLSRAKLRNRVLQQVIRLLSLSPEGRRGRGRSAYGRGRISYAQLGINQLGSVYEGLLSYTGFFSKGTLYEVHRAGERTSDKTQQAYFVPEKELHRYTEEELTFEEPDGTKGKRRYPQGTFIFRLAGRDRENSASYYTPEVLTRCLVKYSLKELLKDKTADQILELTVCEPAMGSGAFLVEATSQLADAYLERKQAETGQKVPPDRYAFEKQRAAAHIAVHNCYGVDLNPTAARLAGVSLWLATMHEGQETPWFGARLAVGNSLVGARLEVWPASDLGTDEELAQALAKVLKKSGNAADLEAQVEAVLKLAEKTAPDAVAAVRKVFEAERRALVAEDDEADGEGNSDAKTPADRAAAARATTLKQLKKLLAAFKQPRCHRKPPEPVPAKDVVAGKRPKGSVYHFLLLDPGMSPFDGDKAIQELAPKEVSRIKEWRSALGKQYTKADAARLAKLSDRVDELYAQVAKDRRRVLDACRSYAPVWGQPEPARPTGGYLPLRQREQALALLRHPTTAFGRLEAAMDLWSALWAWPIEDAAALPAQEAFWKELEAILGVGETAPAPIEQQLELILSLNPGKSDPPPAEPRSSDALGSKLREITRKACARLRPHHWELEFSQVFVDRGGFDLTVGNPPWIKLQWNEQGLLEDLDPRLALDGTSASDAAKKRTAVLGNTGKPLYLEEFAALEGAKAFLNGAQNYPLLVGVQTNLYKCFLERAWSLGNVQMVVGLIHQEGVFQDPNGALLRRELNRRLRHVYRFQNWLMLFPEVMKTRTFCLTVTSSAQDVTCTFTCSNLFHPSTIEASYAHDGEGAVPDIKSEETGFEVRGHRNRIVAIGKTELALFAQLFGQTATDPFEAQLPVLHTREVLRVFEKLSRHPRRLRELGADVFGTEMWHETNSQKDGTIRRETRFPKKPDDWIVSGPHFYVGNPLYKTAREVSRTHRDYDAIDLTVIPDGYLPRTNYVPGCAPKVYLARMPRFQGRPVTEFFRHVNRRMIPVTGERTATAAFIPPGVAHIGTAFSLTFKSEEELVRFSAFLASLPIDFYIRSTGKGDLRMDLLKTLPIPRAGGACGSALAARALCLNCLTVHYADLWARNWSPGVGWSLRDHRLSRWPKKNTSWSREVALRNRFERRWALVEIDALAALELGLTVDELCTIYRTQFPVLRQFESDTWYDRNGRVAFTNNVNLGIGLERKDFELWQHCLASGERLPPDFDKQGLEPPFDLRDREADMRHAYAFFVRELGLEEPT